VRFHETPLQGARLIELEKRGDTRGFFARMFCEREFAAEGLETRFVNVNNSLSQVSGTLRGLHYQIGAEAEVKVVRCVRGALFDAIVDLRPNSPTFLRGFGEILSAENRLMMYAPRGFAHAILTVEPDTEAIYFASAHYAPAHERGLRWNDPRLLDLRWPIAPQEVSAKDASWPDFDPDYHGVESLRIFV
jgi:dTDP-4-dehydrorhamnose 3,5-epimerase